MDERINEVIKGVSKILEELKSQPFQVAVMGQTGVGKSSLINALFETNLPTDPVRPCTKKLQRVEVCNDEGDTLRFYDLPGIGESRIADEAYFQIYLSTLRKADVVLWVLHADNRSITFDVNSLNQLVEMCPADERNQIINKITFVLSKADLIAPVPWICARVGSKCYFAPHKKTQDILYLKKGYFSDALFSLYADILKTTTFLEDGWPVRDTRFIIDEEYITFKGYFDASTYQQFANQFPSYKEVFERLWANHRIIPCSSLFRYNLFQVLNVVVNKLGTEAIARFEQFFSGKALHLQPFEDVKRLNNLIIVDAESRRVLFDLTQFPFEE